MKIRLFWVLLFSLSLNFALADEFEVNGIFYSIVNSDNNEVSVEKGGNYYGYMQIPSTIEYENSTYTVTSIGTGAFSECKDLISITLPTSLKEIKDYAFKNCWILNQISIPENVISIGVGAFMGCQNLRSMRFPNSVTTIGENAFNTCYKLSEIKLPDGLEKIESNTFSMCESLVSIDIPNSVTEIGLGAFFCCRKLRSITLPNSVVSIGGHLFYGCSDLKYVTLSENLSEISSHMFFECVDLENVNMPKNVSLIGKYAFYACKLSDITIPSTVTKIDDYAFLNCCNLNSITVMNANPPLCTVTTFNGVDKDICKLLVPIGSEDLYKSAIGWQDFLNIYNINDSKVDNTLILDNDVVDVYTPSGVLVYHGELKYFRNRNSLYIVKYPQKSQKMFVK